MKCPTCESCEYEQYCGATEIMRKCERHNKKVEQTNEEWRKTCSAEEFTKELAKVVLDLVSWNNDPKPSEVRNILKAWLKQPHTSKE